MGMTADDQIQPWELFGHLDVVGITQMRQQDGDVTFLAETLILGDDLLGGLETDALQIVGMGAGNTGRTQLDAADDTNLQPLDVEHLSGNQFDTGGIGGKSVGADVSEVRKADQPFQRMYVELMVA